MRDPRVGHRYAKALFQAALARNIVDIMGADLAQLKSFSEKDRRFYHFLESPDIRKEDKVNLIKTVFTPRLSQPLVSFLMLLVEKNRVEFLGDIAREFEEIIEDYQGIIKARITTAIPVSDEYKARLIDRLEVRTGKKIEIIHRIDKGIIGGIIVQLDYQVIDHSIRHELDTLRHAMMSIKVY
jgi:F-type H+-transporting ATPase subunit delta